MPHWVAKYIGLPYEEGARGPLAWDCWGIIQLIYTNERGIQLPELPGLNAEQLARIHEVIITEAKNPEWTVVKEPTEGCIVGMGNGHQVMHHVGVYVPVDGGKVIHSRPKQNTVAETVRQLSFRGLHVLNFYQHTLWPG